MKHRGRHPSASNATQQYPMKALGLKIVAQELTCGTALGMKSGIGNYPQRPRRALTLAVGQAQDLGLHLPRLAREAALDDVAETLTPFSGTTNAKASAGRLCLPGTCQLRRS